MQQRKSSDGLYVNYQKLPNGGSTGLSSLSVWPQFDSSWNKCQWLRCKRTTYAAALSLNLSMSILISLPTSCGFYEVCEYLF